MEVRLGAEFGDIAFAEFRRKVRGSDVLKEVILRLLRESAFSGKVCVLVQNGRILKSGYEEGYFRQKDKNGQDDEDKTKH
jgi:hypothetical protein